MISVTADEHGNVHLQHASRAADPSYGPGFVMTGRDWEGLLWRAACYELERRRLPRTLPLADTLGDRLVLSGPQPAWPDQLAGR